MTSGINNRTVILRKAEQTDLDSIKTLIDKHRNELGFVIRNALARSIDSSEIIIAVDDSNHLLGFVHYRHRKDEQTTLYNLVVTQPIQRLGIGTMLIDQLAIESKQMGKKVILLKCPQNLPANEFYRNYGFTLIKTESGKTIPLSIWTLPL